MNMFSRLFGETEQDQLDFLHWRSLATIALAVIGLIGVVVSFISEDAGSAIGGGAFSIIALLCLFMWGWPVLKRFFGITTIAALFSGNVIWGLAIFVVYLIIAYFLGIIIGLVGVLRYI